MSPPFLKLKNSNYCDPFAYSPDATTWRFLPPTPSGHQSLYDKSETGFGTTRILSIMVSTPSGPTSTLLRFTWTTGIQASRNTSGCHTTHPFGPTETILWTNQVSKLRRTVEDTTHILRQYRFAHHGTDQMLQTRHLLQRDFQQTMTTPDMICRELPPREEALRQDIDGDPMCAQPCRMTLWCGDATNSLNSTLRRIANNSLVSIFTAHPHFTCMFLVRSHFPYIRFSKCFLLDATMPIPDGLHHQRVNCIQPTLILSQYWTSKIPISTRLAITMFSTTWTTPCCTKEPRSSKSTFPNNSSFGKTWKKLLRPLNLNFRCILNTYQHKPPWASQHGLWSTLFDTTLMTSVKDA